jgi:hypothetical protein
MSLPTLFAKLAYDQQLQLSVLTIAVCTSLTSLLLVGSCVAVTWYGLPAYIVPPGGPGLVKPGFLDNGTAEDYATRVMTERWTWRHKTHKTMQTRLLAAAHPSYYKTLQAELEEEGRQARQYEVSSQLVVLQAQVLKRKENIVGVHVTAVRTIYLGKEEAREEEVQADLVLLPSYAMVPTLPFLPLIKHKRPDGIQVAQANSTPAFRPLGD